MTIHISLCNGPRSSGSEPIWKKSCLTSRPAWTSSAKALEMKRTQARVGAMQILQATVAKAITNKISPFGAEWWC